MKVLLIGTVMQDTIYSYDGTKKKSFGGLIYLINAMRSALDANDRILPVSWVGEDIYEQLSAYLGDDQRIDLSGLCRTAQKNNRVELRYTSPDERIERSLYPFPPLEYEHIEGFLDFDIAVFNFISGWDLGYETMARFRTNFKSLIYMDLHSLTLGRKEDGIRYYRPLPEVDKWIALCDIMQLNQNEFNLINERQDQESDYFRNHCLDHDKIINLTKAEQGSVTYFKENEALQSCKAKPPVSVRVKDPTGCGDAFAAGFLNHYFKTSDIREAAKKGNIIASIFGHFKGVPEPEKVKSFYRSFLAKEL